MTIRLWSKTSKRAATPKQDKRSHQSSLEHILSSIAAMSVMIHN